MTFWEYLKTHDSSDKYLLFAKHALGMNAEEIALKLGVAKSSVYNAEKRYETLFTALENVQGGEKLEYGNKDVNTIIEAFKEAYGTTKVTKYDRFAATRLAKKHGAQNVATVIKALATSEDKFAPSVNSVSQLEEKWVSVGNLFKRSQGNKEIDL